MHEDEKAEGPFPPTEGNGSATGTNLWFVNGPGKLLNSVLQLCHQYNGVNGEPDLQNDSKEQKQQGQIDTGCFMHIK